jgi:hypothetical protein
MKDALGYDFFIMEDDAPVELDAMLVIVTVMLAA